MFSPTYSLCTEILSTKIKKWSDGSWYHHGQMIIVMAVVTKEFILFLDDCKYLIVKKYFYSYYNLYEQCKLVGPLDYMD